MLNTDFSDVKFSEHSSFGKRQLQNLKISSSLPWLMFEICVTTIAKVRNVYFPHDS